MKTIFLLVCSCILSSSYSQELPSWYKDLIRSKVGEWVADNSTYKNEEEKSSYYSIHWWRGANDGELHGVLKNENDQVIWSYYQYFEEQEKIARLIQMGMNGTIGRGELSLRSDTLILELRFISKSGEEWKELHQSFAPEIGIEESRSFWKTGEELILNRVYSWKKQTEIKL